MKKILWGCIVANVIYSLAQFKDIITLAYIVVLLLLTILISNKDLKLVNSLCVIVAIFGIILSIFSMGTIMIIISGIVIILQVIQEGFIVTNKKKYDKNLGINDIKEREINKIKIVNKYDIDRIRDIFDSFIAEFDKTNYLIDMQYKHAINVANNATNIARSIRLDEEGRYLAYIIGILHDIGKFEEIRLYKNIYDVNTINHVDLGCDLLKNGLIRQFIHENKYDEIIIKAISNHNKFSIDDSFSDDEKLYCSILRDADKLDIYKRLSEGKFENDYKVTKSMLISSEITREINLKHSIEFRLVNNDLDQVILRIAMVYDINHDYTFKLVRENDYLNKYIILLDTLDSNKLILKKIVNDVNLYIDNKLNKKSRN